MNTFSKEASINSIHDPSVRYEIWSSHSKSFWEIAVLKIFRKVARKNMWRSSVFHKVAGYQLVRNNCSKMFWKTHRKISVTEQWYNADAFLWSFRKCAEQHSLEKLRSLFLSPLCNFFVNFSNILYLTFLVPPTKDFQKYERLLRLVIWLYDVRTWRLLDDF